VSIICSSGVSFTHTAHPYTVNEDDPYDIVTQIVSFGEGGVVGGSPTLHYRVDGGDFNALTLSATGEPDEYAVSIPAQPFGSIVEYYLTAENEDGDAGVSPLGAPVSCHIFGVNAGFSDALEADGGWLIGMDGDDAVSGVWTRADPVGTLYESNVVQPEDDHTVDPGVACFVTGNGEVGEPAGANDVDGGRITLLTPVFDLTGGSDIQIGFWRWYTNNRGYNPSEDYWRVEISNDAGESWSIVENTTLSSNAWVEVAFDLADFFAVPDRVQLRFTAEDANYGSLVEAAVDDFTITGNFGAPTGVGDVIVPPVAAVLDQNRPNPFNPSTRIKFELVKNAPVGLSVYDTRGRLVRVLVDGSLSDGTHSVWWNGTDDHGRPSASGIYYYVLESGRDRLKRRMTLVR